MTNKKTAKILKNLLTRLFLLTLVVGLVIAGIYLYFTQKPSSATEAQSEKKDIHLEFLKEISDKIKENYWEKISNEDLTELYQLALNKSKEEIGLATSSPANPESSLIVTARKNEIEQILKKDFENLAPETKKELAVNIASLVLANLKPFGRSGLYTEKNVQQLSETIQNIDSATDLYSELGVEKNASFEEIKKSYEEKNKNLKETVRVLTEKTELTKDEQKQKDETESKLAKLNRAYETLSKPEEKENYDQSGIESTANSHLLTPKIAYLQIKKFSPTTFEEFINELDSLEDEPELKTLILDFRDNIGGSIDYLPYFLGIFLGNNQHGYDWYHQESYTSFRTKNNKMPVIDKLKNTIILANEATQSSAELMLATLKLYNLGIFVGSKTKGWGTIEKVYPLKNQIAPQQETYSMYLVHSVTLRDNDGQPIEGRGIDPDIDITQKDWEQQLTDYFEDEELTKTVKELLKK